MEHFDSVGRYRKSYRGGLKIDSSGSIYGKHKFTDMASFKKAILNQPEVFTRAFTKHMLSYALGRHLVITDEPAIDKIVAEVKANDYRFSSLVLAIVKSYPIQHKTNQAAIKGAE